MASLWALQVAEWVGPSPNVSRATRAYIVVVQKKGLRRGSCCPYTDGITDTPCEKFITTSHMGRAQFQVCLRVAFRLPDHLARTWKGQHTSPHGPSCPPLLIQDRAQGDCNPVALHFGAWVPAVSTVWDLWFVSQAGAPASLLACDDVCVYTPQISVMGASQIIQVVVCICTCSLSWLSCSSFCR